MLTGIRLIAGMLLVVGAAIFAVNAWDAPPGLREIPSAEVRLESAELFDDDGGGKGVWLHAAGTRYVLAGPDERARFLHELLDPGDRLVIWSTHASFNSRTVWQVVRDGKMLVSHEFLALRKRERNRRIDLLARWMLLVGAAGSVGGWLAARSAGLRTVKYRMEPKNGVFHGVEYTVMLFDEAVSVEIDLGAARPERLLSVGVRDGKPVIELAGPSAAGGDGRTALEFDDRWKPISALVEMGAEYIEAGANAAIVGVRFPVARFPYAPVPSAGKKSVRTPLPDAATVEKAVDCLIRLRDACR